MTRAVLHHPHDHPYVRRLPHTSRRLDVWDPASLAAAGIRVVHVHFGFEQRDVDDLAAWAARCRRHRLRVVFTAHDVDNPHLVDQRPHHDAVRELVRHADAVLTLTDTAAARLGALTGSRPVVVPHPHVVPLGRIARRRPRRPEAPIYVHAATCRPNLDADLVVAVARSRLGRNGLRVHVRRPLDGRAAALAARLERVPGVRLEVADRLDDGQLWDRIDDASAVLLPYRWGTHSGLLEAARDLGTPALAPPVGGLFEQGAVLLDERCEAVDDVVVRRPVTLRSRLVERRAVAARHAALYRSLVAA